MASLFVDLDVIHPDCPDRYVLGIDCDGDWCRKAKSARDRERLRKTALRDKEWDIYRVWVSEWFQRPSAELDRLILAIEKAASDLERIPSSSNELRRPVLVAVETVDRGDFIEVGLAEAARAPWVQAYEQARFPVTKRQELHLVPPAEMVEIVQKIVDVEGPIHRDEVINRVRDLWGLGRAGASRRPSTQVLLTPSHSGASCASTSSSSQWPAALLVSATEARWRHSDFVVRNTCRHRRSKRLFAKSFGEATAPIRTKSHKPPLARWAFERQALSCEP